MTRKGRVTACDSESWKFFGERPREAFLSGFLVTRCHTVTQDRILAGGHERLQCGQKTVERPVTEVEQ